MAQPFYMQYELSFCNGNACMDSFDSSRMYANSCAVNERTVPPTHMILPVEMFWCDKVTGLSNNFWLRAEGWFAMAIADTWEIMPESMNSQRDELKRDVLRTDRCHASLSG